MVPQRRLFKVLHRHRKGKDYVGHSSAGKATHPEDFLELASPDRSISFNCGQHLHHSWIVPMNLR